jgi:hypothetical protein
MTLAVIDSKEKQECMQKFLLSKFLVSVFNQKSTLMISSGQRIRGRTLWVSGKTSSECDGKYAFCAVNEVLEDYTLIPKVERLDSESDVCIAMEVNASSMITLKPTSCIKQLFYLCEV